MDPPPLPPAARADPPAPPVAPLPPPLPLARGDSGGDSHDGVLPRLAALRVGSSGGGGTGGGGGGSPSLDSWRPSIGGGGGGGTGADSSVGGGGGGSGSGAFAPSAPPGGAGDEGSLSGGGGSGIVGGAYFRQGLRPFAQGGSRSSFPPPPAAAGGAAGAGAGASAVLDTPASPASSVVSLPGSRTPPPFALGARGPEGEGEAADGWRQQQQQQQQQRGPGPSRASAAAAAGAAAGPRPLAAELEAATAAAMAAGAEQHQHQQQRQQHQQHQQHQQQHAAYETASIADAAQALADADALLRPPPSEEAAAAGAAAAGAAGAAAAATPPQASVSSPPRPPTGPPFSARRQSVGTAAATAAASRRPFIIGVAGGTASGKTTVCDRIMQRLNDQCAVLLSQDSFYKPLTPDESERARLSAYNFDVPQAFDTPLLLACLAQLCDGRAVDVPVYDFATHSRLPGKSRKVEPAPVIVVEGILVLAIPEIREVLSMKVYVDTDDDVRLARRIQRDVAVRGRDVAGVIAQYQKFVKPAFDTYIGPSRRYADVIIPWQQRFGDAAGTGAGAAGAGAGVLSASSRPPSPPLQPSSRPPSAAAAAAAAAAAGPSSSSSPNQSSRPAAAQLSSGEQQQPSQPPPPQEENAVAIDLIAEHIRSKLRQHPLRRLYPQLEVVPSNFQLRGLHTILRDRETEAGDFAFFADRVNRLVIEAGLGYLPFEEKTVVTPTGHRYVGVAFCRGICGVSVIRSGEAMEAALRECCQGIKIGKILVHRHGLAQEEVVYERLPSDIAERHVLLLDPVLGTGHTACRAIQVVLARGVPQHRVLFLCMIATPEGVARVARSFPRVRIVTSEVDARLDDRWRVVPGIGQFGDRYFGL